jgi:phage anti-repressor protein
MRVIIFILMFLIISALVIINNQNLYVIDKNDLQKFSNEYSSWSEKIYKNLISITGQITNMEWIPNTTIQNNAQEIINKELEPNEDEFWESMDWDVKNN